MLNKKVNWKIFSYSKSEIRGFIVLLAIIAILFLLRYRQAESVGEFDIYVSNKPGSNKKYPGISEQHSPFPLEEKANMRKAGFEIVDPNTANYYQLIAVGMPSQAANNLIKYRDKGGQFKSVESLIKIYGIDTVLLSKIYQNFKIKNSIILNADSQKESERSLMKIEINTADTTALKNLPGIGNVLSNRIVKYRDLLGGFYSVEQLSEVYGIDDSLQSRLIQYVSIDSTVIRKIEINIASLEQLWKHPYLSPYQAKAILTYRRLQGTFTQHKQLIDNYLIPEDNYRKIVPYISVNAH